MRPLNRTVVCWHHVNCDLIYSVTDGAAQLDSYCCNALKMVLHHIEILAIFPGLLKSHFLLEVSRYATGNRTYIHYIFVILPFLFFWISLAFYFFLALVGARVMLVFFRATHILWVWPPEGFETWSHHPPAMWSWTSYLNFPDCLNFLICEVGIITMVSTSQDSYKYFMN